MLRSDGVVALQAQGRILRAKTPAGQDAARKRLSLLRDAVTELTMRFPEHAAKPAESATGPGWAMVVAAAGPRR